MLRTYRLHFAFAFALSLSLFMVFFLYYILITRFSLSILSTSTDGSWLRLCEPPGLFLGVAGMVGPSTAVWSNFAGIPRTTEIAITVTFFLSISKQFQWKHKSPTYQALFKVSSEVEFKVVGETNAGGLRRDVKTLLRVNTNEKKKKSKKSVKSKMQSWTKRRKVEAPSANIECREGGDPTRLRPGLVQNCIAHPRVPVPRRGSVRADLATEV